MSYEIKVPTPLKSPLAWDIETIANPQAIKFLKDPKPRANLKDPEKIKADIEAKRQAAIDKFPLNGNTALICACGFAAIGDDGALWSDAIVYDIKTGEEAFLMGLYDVLGDSKQFITFFGMGFDMPMLQRRCMTAGVVPPLSISTYKYGMPPKGNHFDLEAILSGYGAMPTGGFASVCQTVLGEGKLEGVDGSMVQVLWDAGKFDVIRKYAARDAELTLKLWQRAKGIYFQYGE